jgi:hypothetical protein
MTTATKTHPYPFRFDGHGINDAEGQRIFKVQSIEPYDYESGRPVRNPEYDRLSNMLKAAPQLLEACKAIVEFWDEAEADGLATPLHPDALIGGQPNECDPVTIRDVLKAALSAASV